MREKEIREGLAKLTKERAEILYWIFQGKKTNWIADNVLQRTQHDYGYHITEIYETLGYPRDKKTHWTIKRERLIREVYPIFSELVKDEKDLEKWLVIRYEYAKSIPPKEQSSIPEEPEIFIKDEIPASGQNQQSRTQQPRQPQRKTSWTLILLGFGAGALLSCLFIGVVFSIFFSNRPANPLPPLTEATEMPTEQAQPVVVSNPTNTVSFTPTFTPTQKPTSTETPTPYPTETQLPVFEDVQNPPPGTVLKVNEGFSRNGIIVSLDDYLYVYESYGGIDIISIQFYVTNLRDSTYILRYQYNIFHLYDDKGKEYKHEVKESMDFVANRNINRNDRYKYQFCYLNCQSWFLGTIDPSVKYLIFVIDEIAGMKDLRWMINLE